MLKMAKLTKDDIIAIRTGILNGRSYQELGDEFNVSRNCIWNIKHNKTHVGVGPDVSRKKVKKRISRTKKMSICTAISMGETQKSISKRLKVSASTIAQVKKESEGNRYGIDVSKHSRRKLSEKDVNDIRQRLLEGEKGAALAREYGVTRTHISDIKNGKCWNKPEEHIPLQVKEETARVLKYDANYVSEEVLDEETERNFRKLMNLCNKTK